MAFDRDTRLSSSRASRRTTPSTRGATIHSETLRRVAFSPDEAESRTTVAGKPYVRTRGTLTWRRNDLVRTLMMFGDLAVAMATPMLDGATVVLEGRFRRVRAEDGTPGGEFFVAERLVHVLDAEGRPIRGDGTDRAIEGHWREGHYRRQHHGPGNALVKVVWIGDAAVNGGPRRAA